MGIEVLGPLTVDGADGISPRDRVVLQALVVRADEVVGTEVLADALWGEFPPPTWSKVVQGCVARLRRLLDQDTIETVANGYRLRAHEDGLDSRRFERLVGRARDHLESGDPDRACYVLAEALSLWRGRPLPDLEEWEPGRIEAARLDGLRMEAQELRIEAQVAAGHARSVLEDARRLVAEAPIRERRWCLFAHALYQSGRQTEALQALARAKGMLREELGLDPSPELARLEEAILRRAPELVVREVPAPSAECPYRGLLPYQAEDTEAFFGREQAVAACLQRLRERSVLAVVGPSGTGKSSLVRAGVVAVLRAEGTRVVVSTPGAHPLDSLTALPQRGTPPVLVVDQAEEVLTLCEDAAERTAYFAFLAAYAGPLVVAMRADHLGDLSAHADFARLVEEGLYLLTAMDEAGLRSAVEGPAHQAGLRLEGGLTDLLVREVAGEPGALPLLSHVLRRTWELREGSTMTVEGYRRTGGVRNAVSQSAEDVYGRLDEAQRDQMRGLFLRLVTPNEDGDPVRTRVPRRKLVLDPTHQDVVEALISARLLSSDEGDLQIAHEALAREWPRLRGWLADDVDGQRILRHLSGAAEAWEGLGRPGSELYRGGRLVRATEWVQRTAPELTPIEAAYLDASRQHAELEQIAAEVQLRAQTRNNRRLRISLGAVAVMLLGALVAGGLAVGAANRADRQAAAADRAATLADRAAILADARRAMVQSLAEPRLGRALLQALAAIDLTGSAEARANLLRLLDRFRGVRYAVHDGGYLISVAASPDGARIAVGSPAGVTTFDAATGRRIIASTIGNLNNVAYSPDGRLLRPPPTRSPTRPAHTRSVSLIP